MRNVSGVLGGVLLWSLLLSSQASAKPFVSGDLLGVSAGAPTGLSLEYAHEFGRREVFVAGGYFGSDLNGIHGGFTLERDDNVRTYFALNVVGGYFHLEDDEDFAEWRYGGFEGAFHHRAFFIAPAVTFGQGESDSGDLNGVLILARAGFRWGV